MFSYEELYHAEKMGLKLSTGRSEDNAEWVYIADLSTQMGVWVKGFSATCILKLDFNVCPDQ